jgi:glycosyltransferase involved in cell wall biosynthesis
VSEASLADIRRFDPAVVGRSSVAYSGVDAPPVEPAPLPWDPPTIAVVGRLAPEKGIDVLLRALADLDGVRLTVAGDGPERARLDALADELGVADRVTWLGWVRHDELWAVLQQATVVAVPSRQDAFPRIAVEAAHLQRPVVASAVGGLRESVVDHATGLLVPPADPAALARALARVLGDPASARELGAAGRAHAAGFTLTATVEHHLDRYAAILRT